MSTVTDPPGPTENAPMCLSCGHTAYNRACDDCGGGIPNPGRMPCNPCLLRGGGVPASPLPPPPPMPLTADASAVGEWRGNPIQHDRDDEADSGRQPESGE